MKSEQLRKISSAIMGKFNVVFLKSKECEQKREWLQANFGQWVSINNPDGNLGTTAKFFAGGALAAANPIIGIPMLLFNMSSEDDKYRQQAAFCELYSQKFDEYCLLLDVLGQDVSDARNNVINYLSEKFDEIFKGVTEILKETSASGNAIDHYFAYLNSYYNEEWWKYAEENEFFLAGALYGLHLESK